MLHPLAHPATSKGRLFGLGFVLLLAGLVGCEEERISQYSTPKDPPLPAWANDDLPRLRMITAIVPHDGKVWFFKLLGTDVAVTAMTEHFAQFVRSIRFTRDEKKPVEWTLPKGWVDKGPSGSRMATIQMKGNGQPAELTVTPLGPESGDVLANVRRWRQQLGYGGAALAPDQLERSAFEHNMPYGKITVVDLVSVPLNLKAGVDPHAQVDMPDERPASRIPKLDYQLPDGWAESERPTPMAIATLSAGPADKKATVTISPMPGAAGGLLDNVNRWRGQVGLEPIKINDVPEHASKLIVAKHPALFFRFTGPEADPGATGAAPQRSIFVVMSLREGFTWFIKLSGDAKVATDEEPAFIRFVESIQFPKDTAEGNES